MIKASTVFVSFEKAALNLNSKLFFVRISFTATPLVISLSVPLLYKSEIIYAKTDITIPPALLLTPSHETWKTLSDRFMQIKPYAFICHGTAEPYIHHCRIFL